jgi:hypothetical protein
MLDDLISVAEVAELAGERPATVSTWKLRYADFPEGTRNGRQVLFDRSAILGWLAHHRPDYGALSVGDRGRDTIRAVARSDDAAEVALSLLCLTALAPDEVAKAIDGGGGSAAIAALARHTEAQLGLSGVLAPLDDRVDGDWLAAAIALLRTPAGAIRPRVELKGAYELALSERANAWVRRVSPHRSATWLAELMFDLVADAVPAGGRLLDPAAGDGGFLVSAGQRSAQPLALHGWERNSDHARIARQRLLVHGLVGEIDTRDSLGTEHWDSLEVDAVISEPPLGLRLDANRWQADDPRWRDYGFPAPHADLAWVLLALHHLAPSGRAAILTGRGALFRPRSEALIRRRLLESGAIDAVIALPGGSVMQSGVPLALWLLRAPGAAPSGHVLLIDASDTAIQRRPGADDEARLLADRIRTTVTDWRGPGPAAALPSGFAVAHPTRVLAAGDAVLDPVRLVHLPAGTEELTAEIHRVQTEHGELLAQLSTKRLPPPSAGARTPPRRITIGELLASGRASLLTGRRTDPTSEGPGVPVLGPWTFNGEAPRYSDGAVGTVAPGDVLVAPRHGGIRARVADEDDAGAALEAPLQAIRLHAPVEDVAASLTPGLLADLISIQQPASIGTVGRMTVKALEIPLLDPGSARELGATLALLRAEAELITRLEQTRDRLQVLLVEQFAR